MAMILILGVLAIVGVVATVRAVRNDGYGRIPTRSNHESR